MISSIAASLSERIYTSAFNPGTWSGILEDLAKATGARFASLAMYSPRFQVLSDFNTPSLSFCDSAENQKFIESVIEDLRASSLLNAGFFESDLSKGDLPQVRQRERLASEFARHRIGPQVGAMIDIEGGSVISLNFGRWIGEGSFGGSTKELTDALYPAYLHALRFSSLLQFNRAKGAAEALCSLDIPAAIVSPTGNVVYQNALFEKAGDYLIRSKGGKIDIRDRDVQRSKFAKTLDSVASEGVSFPMKANAHRTSAIVHFIPVHRGAGEILPFPFTIVILSTLDTRRGVPRAELLQSLFGLTPGEAKLSHHLASGQPLNVAAATQGITVGTARTYLHRIFLKTDTQQQSELISLIKSGVL